MVDNQLKEIEVASKESYKIGYNKAKEDIKLQIEKKIEDLENEVGNRNMNDLEYGAYTKLLSIMDMIDEL